MPVMSAIYGDAIEIERPNFWSETKISLTGRTKLIQPIVGLKLVTDTVGYTVRVTKTRVFKVTRNPASDNHLCQMVAILN